MSVEALEEERDELRKELRAVQEMLAHVLLSVGEPVAVTKESLDKGLAAGTQIRIDDNLDSQSFTFWVEVPE